jgi:hypothetical protein
VAIVADPGIAEGADEDRGKVIVTASAVTSFPIPSPGMTAMRIVWRD